MTVSEKIITRNLQHTLETQPQNTCVMLDENGKEINITKDMVVTVCHQLLKQCRNIKN